MGKLTLKQAAAWCGGWVDPKYENIEFLGANNDTRVLQPGQLFIVLQGARDGHDFIPAAMEKGAAAALCSRKVGDYPAIIVDDPRIALGQIAHHELKRIGCKAVAVSTPNIKMSLSWVPIWIPGKSKKASFLSL